MKRKNMTRSALVTSILALLLCVSMLVGTTFAWFTDTVESGMNTIAAGNLDIELLANGDKVDANTKLFDDVDHWEPGVVVYENLQVANVGTLALKYQMTLNFGGENNLNGHKLSEVLKIAVIDKVADNATREQVLAAAKAAIDASNSDGSLSNFYLTGELEAGVSGTEQTVVIFWAPNDNDIDNLYNANNGQVTSDGEPLHIKFGINLQATQKMSEEDSFGNDYDESATILPKATVNNLGMQTVYATAGIGGATAEYDLPFSLQFLPNETLKQAQASSYRYWHADYVVKADKDVPADSVALLGYYDAWCQYNNDNWVAMINEGAAIDANTEIRLVELLGTTVNYEDICEFGNDPEDLLPANLEGFLCSAVDLTGQNAGTTITVELRMYEVPAKGECANGAGCTHPDLACEIGKDNYKVIGTYSYTFGAKKVASLTDLEDAASVPGAVIDAQGANLGDFNYDAKFANGVVVKNAKFTYFYGGNVEGTVTFENCEFVSDHSYCANFDSGNGNIVFNNCTFDGWSSFGTAITNVEMNNCTFQKSYNYGVLRFYQTAQLNNCTFADNFEGVDTNATGYKVEFTNCTGIDGKIYNNGSNQGIWVVNGTDISSTVTSW